MENEHYNAGQNNGQWKGDKVGYKPLHEWVRKHLLKPKLCQMCNKVPPHDLTCATGKYTRDFANWKYFCRSCHMISDGRLNNLKRGGHHLLGMKKSDEAKRKISEAMMGKPLPESTKIKMRLNNKNRSRDDKGRYV